MNVKHGKMKTLLIMLLTLYFSIGLAMAANSPKTVLCIVKKSNDVSFPAAADTVIKVTDGGGQIATYSGTNTGEIAYAEVGGVINIALGNFTKQWAAGDTVKIAVTSGTAGTLAFEFGEISTVLDGGPLQQFAGLILTASQRNMTKTAGDGQTQVYGTQLTTKLEVTVVDDLGNPVQGQTPTATGDGTISAFTATDATGKSTATWTLGAGVGPQTMTVSLAGYPDAVFTATATAGPLVSYTVEFTALDGTAGAVNPIRVTAKDAGGNVITNHAGTVSFTSIDTAAALPANYKFVAGDKGVKIFNVTLKTAGSQTVTVTTGSIAKTVTANVVPAAASKIDLKTSAETIASEGIGSTTLTATVQDQYGNTVTSETGDVTFTVTGAGTANADWTSKTATLASGVATVNLKSKGTVGGTGSTTVGVEAAKDALTKASKEITIINFSITPETSYKAVGDTIAFSVVGAQGTVNWAVTGHNGVGTLGSFAGANKENAVFTITGPGNAIITVTEGNKKSSATISAYNDVVITNLPTGIVNVGSGMASAAYTVEGGDGKYTWTVKNPAGAISVEGSTATYIFKAPTTGEFAGTYTVTVTDSANTNSSFFTVYVPLEIDPAKTSFVLTAIGNPQGFTVTGAASGTGYTITTKSMDETPPLETSMAGNFNAQNSASFEFDPDDAGVTIDTGTKSYTRDFEAKGHEEDIPSIDIDVVPVRDYEGYIFNLADGHLPGAIVTITSPPNYAGRFQTSDPAGFFSFKDLPAPEMGKYQFKVELLKYVPRLFSSDLLDSKGTSEIEMKTSEVHIAGTVTDDKGVPVASASVNLFGTAGMVSEPTGSGALGDFRFEFETAPTTPVSYTIRASKPGFSGFTTITANSFDYTGVTITLTALAKQYTPTGTEPAGGIGVIDASAGGEADMTGDVAAEALTKDEFLKVQNSFGGNAIKLVIAPQPGKGVITAALPEPFDYTDTSKIPASAINWEIEGFGDGCARVSVPFSMSEASGIKAKTLVVWYADINTPDDKKVARIIGEPDYIGDGTTGLLYAEVCGFSIKAVWIGAAPASAGSSTSSDSSGCFINSVSGSPGAMMAWLAIAGVLAAGIVLRMGRRSKSL